MKNGHFGENWSFCQRWSFLLKHDHDHRDKIKDEPVIDEPEDRIVGGTDVDISERPFQIVFLYYGSLRCGGSWIGGNAVLTAAHCCDGVSASSVSVRVGSSRYSSGGDVSFRISFNFSDFFFNHSGYVNRTF